MAQVAFDTLKFVGTLENSGLPQEQAKAISIAVRESHEMADVATKADIIELKRDLDSLEARMGAKIDKLGLQLTVRFGGMMVIAVGALAATIRMTG